MPEWDRTVNKKPGDVLLTEVQDENLHAEAAVGVLKSSLFGSSRYFFLALQDLPRKRKKERERRRSVEA